MIGSQKYLYYFKNYLFCSYTLFWVVALFFSLWTNKKEKYLHRDDFLQYHIIVNIVLWNKICRNPFHLNLSLLFSYQLHFQNKKWNLVHLAINPSQFSCYNYTPQPSYHFSSHAQETVSVWRSSRWNKAKRNIIYIYIWKKYTHIYQPLRSGRIWHKVNF